MSLSILSATQNIMRLLLLLNLCDAWIGVVSSLVSMSAISASVFCFIISESPMDITTYLALIIPPVLLLTYTPKSLDLWHAGSLIQQDPVHMGHWALWPLVMVLHNSDCIEHKSVFAHSGLCATHVGCNLYYNQRGSLHDSTSIVGKQVC